MKNVIHTNAAERKALMDVYTNIQNLQKYLQSLVIDIIASRQGGKEPVNKDCEISKDFYTVSYNDEEEKHEPDTAGDSAKNIK